LPAASNDQLEATVNILERRFKDYSASPAGRQIVTRTTGGISIDLDRVQITEKNARLLALTQGAWEVALTQAPTTAVATERDIQRADAIMERNGAYIKIRLAAGAARRLEAVTRANIGTQIAVKLDGNILLQAPIRGEFGEELVFTVPDDTDATVLRTILTHGRLPARPELATVPNGA
jgi:preprotein translocase subunit SecD